MNYIIINDLKQIINFYLLPKKQNDNLLINMPLIILEPISKWIDSKSKMNLYLLLGSSKFTFTKASVLNHKNYPNRYGIESRELIISFDMMISGYFKNVDK